MTRIGNCADTRAYRTGAGLAALLLAASICVAGKEAKLPTDLGAPGAVVIHDAFDRPAVGDAWTVGKGSWTIEDGALVGREQASDQHAGVCSTGGPFRDSILRFSFQLDGAKQFAVSLNKAKGHLFRVVVAENGLTLTLDKDKSDLDSKPQVLAKAMGVIEPRKWHTLQLEIVGDQVIARTDSGLKVVGKHESLATEKTGYRFVVSGEAVRIDDVVVTAAEARK